MPKASERRSDVMKHLNKEQWCIASRGLLILLVAVLICISMIAFSVMNKSVAWFSNNKNVEATGLSVIISNGAEADVKVTSYAVSEISGNVYTATTEITEELPTHDSKGISYSLNEKALLVEVDISSKESKTLALSLITPNPTVSYELYSPLSNCIQITPVTSFDPTTRKATLNTQQTQSFVTFDDDALTKESSLLLNSSISLTENKHTILYYVIEYDFELFSNYIFNIDADEIFFTHDVTFYVHKTT